MLSSGFRATSYLGSCSKICFHSLTTGPPVTSTIADNVTSTSLTVESEAKKQINTSGKRDLWRVDKLNKFQETPQAWVSSFDTLMGSRKEIIDLHPDVFRVFPRMDILALNLRWQELYRSVTMIKMLNRAELPGSGRKPWPQKGVGRARHGHIRSPLWKGGGITHGIRGPKTRFYMLPDNQRIQGLCVALTIKHAQDDLEIVDDLDTLKSPEKQYIEDLAATRNWGYSVLFVHDTDVAPQNLVQATEDIPYFNIIPYYGLNCLSMIKHDTLVISRKALCTIEQRLLEQVHRLEHKTYNYKDYKETLLNEGEREEEEMPPFV